GTSGVGPRSRAQTRGFGRPTRASRGPTCRNRNCDALREFRLGPRDPIWLVLAFKALNPFRRPLDHAHEGMELPLARDCAADESAEHDLRATSFVRRIIRLGE